MISTVVVGLKHTQQDLEALSATLRECQTFCRDMMKPPWGLSHDLMIKVDDERMTELCVTNLLSFLGHARD